MQVSRIAKHGNAHGITIPRVYLRELRWGPGDYVALEIVQDRLQVSRLNPPLPILRIPLRPGEADDAKPPS